MALCSERERERESGAWGLPQRSMDASILLDWRDRREMEVFRSRSNLEREITVRGY